MSNGLLQSLAENKLIWLPEQGIGYYPVTAQPYDDKYWERYRRMDNTHMARLLTKARIDLVTEYWRGKILDIGIGGGLFVDSYPHYALGYDVNPHAAAHLTVIGRWQDPYEARFEVGTFWDSLEHIADPTLLLANITQWAFVSIPIFKNLTAVIESKHYRKDEHFWYFTHNGFLRFMEVQGFAMKLHSFEETRLGRESISSYAFQRVAAPPAVPQLSLPGLVTEKVGPVDGPVLNAMALG